MHQSVGTHPNPAFCYPLLGRDEMKETHVPASSEILRDTPPASASNLQTGGDLIQAVSLTASWFWDFSCSEYSFFWCVWRHASLTLSFCAVFQPVPLGWPRDVLSLCTDCFLPCTYRASLNIGDKGVATGQHPYGTGGFWGCWDLLAKGLFVFR